MNEREIMISVRDVSAGYGKVSILENLTFDIPSGEIVAVLGGSGCGKSTLLKHMIGLYKPLAGDILLDGESIVTCDSENRRRIMGKFGVAYQGGALFRSLSLFENIALPLQERTSLTESRIAEKVREKLSLVGLEGYENYMPSDLSGGMIKRGAFARAMALDPRMLFFDEPSAGLDPINSANLDKLILDIRRKTCATIVIVTHELDSIFTVADRIIMLSKESKGIIADGDPHELKKHSGNEFVFEFLNRGRPQSVREEMKKNVI